MSNEPTNTEDTGPVNRSTHWVEDLLKPHFSLEDVMESLEELRKKTFVCDHSLPKCLQTAEGRKIYEKVLLEKQQEEEKLLRDSLAKRLAAEKVSGGAAGSTKSQASRTTEGLNKQPEESDHIWNKEDLSVLCETLSKIERDRQCLRLRLQEAQAEVRVERRERQRLQGLLDECEKQLALSRQEVARWTLQLEAQQAEGRAKDTQIQTLAMEARQMAEEMACCRTAARKGRQETKEAQQKCSDLTWELERLKEHHRVEERRLVEIARLEESVTLQKLTRELEETRAKLEAEKSNHARSRSALELLRKHFTNQSR